MLSTQEVEPGEPEGGGGGQVYKGVGESIVKTSLFLARYKYFCPSSYVGSNSFVRAEGVSVSLRRGRSCVQGQYRGYSSVLVEPVHLNRKRGTSYLVICVRITISGVVLSSSTVKGVVGRF